MLRFALGWDWPSRDIRWVTHGGTCLEIGFGGGFYTADLADRVKRLIALDLDPAAGRRLVSRLASNPGVRRQSPAVDVIAGDGTALPMATGSVERVFYGYSLEEMPDPAGSLAEALRVLAPGGELVLFLWRPICRGARRRAIFAALEAWGEPVRASHGPQNIRLHYRRPIA